MRVIYMILGLFYSLIIALSIVFIIALFYLLPRRSYRSIRRYWAIFVLTICGVRISLRGKFSPDAKLLVMNHASILDIVLLECLHPANLCWLAKKEISQLPIFGQIIKKPQMISVNRLNAREFIHTLNEAKERVEQGRVLAIFPEGTRGDGVHLKPFKRGASMISQKLNTSIQPIIIAASRRAMDSKGTLMIRPFTRVIVQILPVCSELDGVEQMMQEQLNELNAELKILPAQDKNTPKSCAAAGVDSAATAAATTTDCASDSDCATASTVTDGTASDCASKSAADSTAIASATPKSCAAGISWLSFAWLSFFGAGLSPAAPGTAGSLAAAVCAYFLLIYFDHFTLILLAILIFIISLKPINEYEKHHAHDASCIVIDEVCGVFLAIGVAFLCTYAQGLAAHHSLDFSAAEWMIFAASVVLFRVFDILKPSIIGRIDRSVKGGLGVMADDVLAGVVAGLCCAVGYGIYLIF